MKIALIVMAGALLALVYYNQKLTNEIREERKALKAETAKVNSVEMALQNAAAGKAHQAEILRAHIAELQKQIQQKKSDRDSLMASVQTMKNLSAGERQLTTVKFDLDNKKNAIDRLEAEVKAVVSQRQGFEQQQRLTASQSKTQKQQIDLQFDQQIEAQREKIANMQNEYNNLKAQKFDLTSQETARRLALQLKDERAAFEQMKIKKRQFNLSGVTAAESPEIASNIAYLKNEEAQLRGELNSVRTDYQNLQAQMKAAKSESGSEHAGVASLQAKVAEADAAIKSLNEQVQADQRQLQNLQVAGSQ